MAEEKQLSSNIQQLLSNLDNFMFVRLFRSFQFATSPNKMLIAFIAVVGLATTGVIMDITTNTVVKTSFSSSYSAVNQYYTSQPKTITELDIYLFTPQKLDAFLESETTQKTYQGVYKTCWDFSTRKFNQAVVAMLSFDLPQSFKYLSHFCRMMGWALQRHTLYSIIYLAIAISILALCGGAICRAAALEYAIDEKPGPGEALNFSRKHLKGLIFAPSAPFLLCLFFGTLLILLGIVANMPWVGGIILGLLMFVALILGLFITMILIGAIGGVSMTMPSIAYEGTDSFDALGRTYCYTYSKPWKLVFYSFISIFYGGICYMFVRFIAFIMLKSTYTFLNMGMFVESAKDKGINKLSAIWPAPEFFNLLGSELSSDLSFTESLSFLLVYLSVLVITGIVSAFCLSYYFSASTIIYSLMRRSIDKTETNVIFLGTEKLEGSWEDIASEQPVLKNQTTDQNISESTTESTTQDATKETDFPEENNDDGSQPK